MFVWPHPPVILLIVKVEDPGEQNILGEAVTLKFNGTNVPGTTKEEGVVQGPTELVPLTHSRAEKKYVCPGHNPVKDIKTEL